MRSIITRSLVELARRRQKNSVHLVLDFDGTLTIQDTMSVFGKLPKDPTLSWDQITQAYMEDYGHHRSTPFGWSKYDGQEYSRWLASRKWIEERSAQRVQDASFFRGVTYEDINQAVDESIQDGTLKLRAGWADLLRLFLPSATPGRTNCNRVTILSVNWSETVIRRALWISARASEQHDADALALMINSMEIHANEIQGLGAPQGSSGRVRRLLDADVRTNDDKLRYFKAMCEPSEFTVYIGDSPTDFDCICAADLGIWLKDCEEKEYETAFRSTFSPLRYTPQPIFTTQNLDSEQSTFLWSPDFERVTEALCELTAMGQSVPIER